MLTSQEGETLCKEDSKGDPLLVPGLSLVEGLTAIN